MEDHLKESQSCVFDFSIIVELRREKKFLDNLRKVHQSTLIDQSRNNPMRSIEHLL